MFSDWVINIFSYNRASSLNNLLQSIATHYPEAKVAIFDDESDDKTVKQILEQAKANGAYVQVGCNKQSSSKHGGLYDMMNEAIKYAYDNNYKYAYYVQDDMQFLWRDEGLNSKVKEVFNREDCLMCNSTFLQKIFTKGVEKRLPKVEGSKYFALEHDGTADTGIVDVEKARKVDFFFPEQSEGGNGTHWFNKGYALYWLPQPHLAWVPWPTTYRFKNVENRADKVLKPLSVKAIQKLQQNDSYAFLEDYTSLKGFYIKPYWYAANPGWLNLLKLHVKFHLRSIM